jgi:hypothetical protein
VVLGPIDRYVHLLDSGYDSLCFIRDLSLLGSNNSNVIMQCFRESSEKLFKVSQSTFVTCYSSHLGLPRLSLMARDAYLVEKAVKLSNDGRDLRRQVVGIHIDGRIARSALAQRVACRR